MKFFLFNPESPLLQFFSKLGRLMFLNLLFVISCIPVITIGAAASAMYTVTLKQARLDEPHIAETYFKAFKKNFLQSTILWIIWLALGFLLYLDFKLLIGRTAIIATIMRVLLYGVILLAYMMFSYTFPLQASFYNTIRQTLKNTFYISIWHIKRTIPILVIPVFAVVITLLTKFTLYYGIMLWFLFGFAVCAQLKSHYFVQVFDYYTNPPESEENDADNENDDIPVNEEKDRLG